MIVLFFLEKGTCVLCLVSKNSSWPFWAMNVSLCSSKWPFLSLHNSVILYTSLSVSSYCLELFDVFVMVNIVRMLHSIEPRA